MQIGLFHSIQWPAGSEQSDRYGQALRQAELAEAIGFDSIWLTEHHFSRHGIVSDSLAVLAYLAARTERVRLGTAVTVLPLHDPVRLAETAATVDMLSGGRLDLGIGRGYQSGEFSGFGLDIGDKVSRFEEAVEVLQRAWGHDSPFTHHGTHWQYRDCAPQPRPIQRPHPPIWQATESTEGMLASARHDWGILFPQGSSLSRVESKMSDYHKALDEAGRAPDEAKVYLARGFYTAPSTEQAWDDAAGPYIDFLTLAGQLAGATGLPGDHAGASDNPERMDAGIRQSAIFGSPDDCITSFRRIRDLGIERVMLFVHMGKMPHQKIVDSLELFGKEVLPVVREF